MNPTAIQVVPAHRLWVIRDMMYPVEEEEVDAVVVDVGVEVVVVEVVVLSEEAKVEEDSSPSPPMERQ